jgi:hypothetical protein
VLGVKAVRIVGGVAMGVGSFVGFPCFVVCDDRVLECSSRCCGIEGISVGIGASVLKFGNSVLYFLFEHFVLFFDVLSLWADSAAIVGLILLLSLLVVGGNRWGVLLGGGGPIHGFHFYLYSYFNYSRFIIIYREKPWKSAGDLEG